PNRLSKRTYQAMHFLLGGLRSGDRVCACQPRHVLSKAVPGNKGVKIFRRTEIVGIVIPSAHVRTWRRNPFALAKRLEQGIFVEMQEHIVIAIELLAERSR